MEFCLCFLPAFMEELFRVEVGLAVLRTVKDLNYVSELQEIKVLIRYNEMIAESAKFLALERQKQNKRFMLPQGGEKSSMRKIGGRRKKILNSETIETTKPSF